MKPYYQDKHATIYHGDCLEILPRLGPVDLVLTDPPYGYALYDSDIAVDGTAFIGFALITCAFGYPETLTQWCIDIGKVPSAWLVWWPTNAGCKSSRGGKAYTRETEHIAVWGKPLGQLPRKQKSTRAIDPEKYGCVADRRGSDILRDPSPGLAFNSHLRLHQNEKPVSLMSKLVRLMGGDGTILDPFMGSGTTLVAAKELGRKAIGIEISKDYCDIAVKRLRQEVLF